MAASRRFGRDDFVVQDDDGEARLVAFGENAVYGVALAFPEVDDDPYRIDLIRTAREASGIERAQRLTLHEYDSHMEADEGLREVSDALFEGGREAIVAHLPGLAAQPAEYTAGLMVASYPPDAVFTGAEASVSLIAVTDTGIQDAMVGWNLPPHEASHLSMVLEEAQAAGGPSLLLETAAQEAQARGQLEAGQPLLKPAHTTYLDQREMLERDAEIDWGWHAARFAVFPDGDAHQVALLDIYHDALSGDLGGSYLPLGEHASLADAERLRDALEAAAFERNEDSSRWPKFAAQQIEHPQWQSMQPEHYALYERLSGRAVEDDLPADLEPLLAEAMRLGAVVVEVDIEEDDMNNTLKAERVGWQVDLNEHVTHLPPHVTAEYRSPADAEGVVPARLRPQGDESMYGFEVSAPDDAGRVTLAATKTFESEILLRDVTETAVLKTYQAGDYDEATSYLDPRTDALSDARALVYEWGRTDLDHGMGSALKLAQDNGFKGETLFTEGPPETFTPAEDARSLETIQSERDWERDAEIFGASGYKVPLPEDTVHAREVGRYGADADMPPGQFYAVTVREAESVFVVEGLKAWLDRESGETQRDVVALGIEDDRGNATAMANTVAEATTVPERLERMTALGNDFAGRNDPHVEQLGLTVRDHELFTEGPPDPGVEPSPAPDVTAQEYSRIIGKAAYDLPLEDGQTYEFRMRLVPELETDIARYGVDAFSVETVKHWSAEGEPQQEVVTLDIHYDPDDARQEVDTYIDLAEREGIEAAMSRAAVLADIQNYPTMLERAKELNLHPNEDVLYGDMFQRGPDDPFLSERDILYATQQYAADHPPHHRLLLEVVAVQDDSGQALGHSVLALDAAWDHEETSRELDDAQSVAAYEVAQFETQEEAGLFRQSLSDYMSKRGLEPEGQDISDTIDFVKAASETNGHGECWLAPWDIAQLGKGEWTLEHNTEDFHPMTVQTIDINTPAEVSLPDLEL